MSSNGQYDNTNRGALFQNERKTTDKHPDYNGNVMVECPHCRAKSDFWLSGWKTFARTTGKMFLSLSLTEKEAKPAAPAPQQKSAFGVDSDVDKDCPF